MYITGLILLITVILSYILPVIGMLAGGIMSPVYFPAAFIAASFICALWSHDIRQHICCEIIALTIITACVFACIHIEDYSYDGNCYHQEIIARLMNGWNPFHDYHKSTIDAFSIDEISVWAMHYAKAIEISAASIGATTGSVESGKAINLIIIAATFMMIYDTLKLMADSCGAKKLTTISLICCANPVGILQSTTFYTDYSKYYLIVFMLILITRIIIRKEHYDYLLLAGVTIYAIGTKFNIFFDCGLTLILAIAWCLYKKYIPTAVRLTAIGAISLVIGTVITGYHPYITNIITAGNPFYPLLGDEAFDIMTGNTSLIYHGHGRIWNFMVSLFTPSLPTYAGRAGGFGPLMPLLLILSIIILYLCRRSNSVIIYISAAALASCFIFDTSWWARYISQLWLVPSMALIAPLHTQGPKQIKTLESVLITATVLNIILASGQAARFTRGNTMVRHSLYEAIRSEPGASVMVLQPSLQMANHLERAGITWQEQDSTRPLDSINAVTWHQDGINFPILQLTANQKRKLDSIAGNHTKIDTWSLVKKPH